MSAILVFLVMLAIWAAFGAVFMSLCRAAARGDAGVSAVRDSRFAHSALPQHKALSPT